MVAVRIPGAESIQNVAVARDPGVRASPEDFGSQVGDSITKLGNTAVEVGALLDKKREAAAAAMAMPEATARFQLEAVKRNQAIATSKPESAAGTGQQVDADLTPTQEQIVNETKAKYRLNDLSTAKLSGHLTGIRGHAVVNAVTAANNQIVTGLSAQHDETVKTIGATALATGDVDGALKQVDQSVAALRGVVPENDLNKRASASKKVVVDSVIAGLQQSGTKEALDRAEQLTQRFYGSVPKSDIYSAIYAQETGGGRNTSTSVTGARGHMQIQPGTWAMYAKPGENIDNKEDNIAVGKRIIDDLSAKSGGDPARIAVGYFSGPGNIAPPGSPTPWKVDKADPTGKTVSSYVADVTKRLGVGGKPEMADPEKALFWNQKINAAKTKTLATASADTENQFTRQIIDANAGIGTLPSRSAIETNTNIGDDTRNKLLAQYDSAASDVIKLHGAMKKFSDPNGGDFNPFNTDDKKNVDRIYNSLGGDLRALEIVNNRTGMVPKAAVNSLRGSLFSNDPQKVAGAANIAVNLLSKNPTVFAGVDGGNEMEDAAVKMSQYVERFGMSAEDAGRKIIEENTPEYKAKVKARIKNEDIGEIVKKKLSIDDLRSAFDESWWPGSPQVEFTPEARQSAYSDYVELFRDRYMETGDVDVSKAQATKQLKKVWGVSQITGKDVVMRFPPDRAPVMVGIEDPAGKIATQASEAIKGVTGEDISRDKIMLAPLTGGQTARPYAAGQPAPYALSWFDKNGNLQMLNPGQAFVADPKAMREKVSTDRQRQFNVQREAADTIDPDLTRAPFGVRP